MMHHSFLATYSATVVATIYAPRNDVFTETTYDRVCFYPKFEMKY